MNRLWQRSVARLTPGVRGLVLVLGAVYAAAWLGGTFRLFDLPGWLVLSPSAFWRGRLWTLVTYAFLPTGLIEFVINCLLLGWIGLWLERAWSRWELWSYCMLTAAGGGAVKLALGQIEPSPVFGAGPVVYGLAAAWLRMAGNDPVRVWPFGETTARRAGLIALAVSIIAALSSVGLVATLVLLGGALAGWIYLSVRWKLSRAQPSQRVGSQRIRWLEL